MDSKLYIEVLLDMNFDIIASAVVIFIDFQDAYKNSDGIKTAYAAYYNKNCGGKSRKDFLENPDKYAKTYK